MTSSDSTKKCMHVRSKVEIREWGSMRLELEAVLWSNKKLLRGRVRFNMRGRIEI